MIYYKKKIKGNKMNQIIEKLKKTDLIPIFIMLIPFLFGTFYDFSVFVVTLVLQIILLIWFIKNKKISITVNDAFIMSAIFLLFSCLSIIWAVDRNDAAIGTLRYLSLFLFAIFIMQCSSERKEKILQIIPYSALAMLFISIIIGFIPGLKEIVYTASGRIMGLFPYANTFALYLLVGIIIITTIRRDKLAIPITLFLLFGIFLTGSRTTLIIATIYMIYFCFSKENTIKKYYILTYLGLIIAFVIYALVTNNFGRIFNINPNAGTLLERFLYWKDSIKLILTNPFGLGYMGYSYKIYEIQTGMYVTKFVHNEYLQMMLDIGIIPAITFIAFIVKSIISKNNLKLNKIILIAIAIHIFFDLDLQSIIILYIIVMCLDNKIYKEKSFEFNITFIVIMTITAFIYGYYGLACFMNYIGKNDIASNMLTNYTEAKVEVMKNENSKSIHKLADEILKDNKYEIQAYNANSAYYLFNGEFDKMVENKKKEISLDKYNIKVYEEYIMMLSEVLQVYESTNDKDNIIKYSNYIFEVEQMLDDVRNNTDELAYKITSKINFNLSEDINNYINNIRQTLIMERGIKF